MDRIQEVRKRIESVKDSTGNIASEYTLELAELYSHAFEDIEYLLAENQRYKEALERISTFVIVGTVVHGEAMKEIAQEALGEGGEAPTCKHGAIIPSKCVACQAEKLGFDPFGE